MDGIPPALRLLVSVASTSLPGRSAEDSFGAAGTEYSASSRVFVTEIHCCLASRLAFRAGSDNGHVGRIWLYCSATDYSRDILGEYAASRRNFDTRVP